MLACEEHKIVGIWKKSYGACEHISIWKELRL